MVIARFAVGRDVQVRDLGLLDAAIHRPQAQMFGVPAYGDVFEMAGALLHGLVTASDDVTRTRWRGRRP